LQLSILGFLSERSHWTIISHPIGHFPGVCNVIVEMLLQVLQIVRRTTMG